MERSTDPTLLGENGKRGGIIADEMGMVPDFDDPNPCPIPTCRRFVPTPSFRTSSDAHRPPLQRYGQGKTMVVIALCLANPKQGVSTKQNPKTTLVLVNNSLVQQWFDEVSRAAPGLRVRRHYAGKRATEPLETIDILITTPHTKV